MPRNEAGNVFFIIMLGVALFGALTFTFSRGVRQGGNNLTDKQADIAASKIMADVQKVQRNVNRLLSHGVSESQIDFVGAPHAASGDYTNANCADAVCRLFEAGGGNIQPPTTDNTWLDSAFTGDALYGTWVYTSQFCVDELQEIPCSDPVLENEVELLMVLPYVRLDLCNALNKKLRNTSAMPASQAGMVPIAANMKFNGGFPAHVPTGGKPIDPDPDIGAESACVFEPVSEAYIFYSTLIAR